EAAPGPGGRRGHARRAAGGAAGGASARQASGRGGQPAGLARGAGPVQALVPRWGVLHGVLGGPRRTAGARPPARVGVLEERRRRRLALVPRPERHRARRDPRLALRDGGLPRGVASRGRRARELPRGRRAPPPGAPRARAAAAARRLADRAPGDLAGAAGADAAAVV